MTGTVRRFKPNLDGTEVHTEPLPTHILVERTS
jgi:hypothetical protein